MADEGTQLLLTRRQLLVGGAAAAVVGWAGCSDDGDGSGGAGTTTTRPPPRLDTSPFTLGVASGDPRTGSVVLWTRLALDPLAEDGLGGMPDEEIDVVFEVATDAELTDVVAGGVGVASPDAAHAVHVVPEGLPAGTDLHYRFRVGDHTSETGRTRTLPDGSPQAFGIAVVNCQWFELGHYAAYRRLVEEDAAVDLVLHLGDYIYEYPGSAEGERRTLPTKQLETLTDYRLRYASYRMDEHLRAAHARYPFVLTWDDHEVSNNYSGAGLREQPGDADALATRQTAAYRAWWEHLPVRVPAPDGPALDVYQHVDVGDLARIYVLDQRQHADVPPCRDGDPLAEDFGDCPERTEGDRAFLGDAQEAWFADAAAESTARWNLIGNPVVLAGVDGGNDADGPGYYLDSWDGYPTARHRFIEQLAQMDNPVVLTGDYHAGMVLDVHARPFEDSPLVATELMAPPISSLLFSADVSPRTPQLRRQLNGHGYLRVAVTPEQLTAEFRVLADVGDPDSGISTPVTCTIQAGRPEATVTEA